MEGLLFGTAMRFCAASLLLAGPRGLVIGALLHSADPVPGGVDLVRWARHGLLATGAVGVHIDRLCVGVLETILVVVGVRAFLCHVGAPANCHSRTWGGKRWRWLGLGDHRPRGSRHHSGRTFLAAM